MDRLLFKQPLKINRKTFWEYRLTVYYKMLLSYLIIIIIAPFSYASDENAILVAEPEAHPIMVTEEWPPYNYQQDGKLTGFSVEIINNIMQIIGKDYPIRLLPSMRTTRVLDTRPNSFMFSLFRTPERESNYKWIGPLTDGSIFFYKKRNNKLIINNIEDMKKVSRVAVRHKGLIPEILLEQGFKNLDMTATTSFQVYRKLLVERVELAISDTDLGVSYQLKLLNADSSSFEKIPIPIFKSDLYIAVNKSVSDEEIELWQFGLDTLKKNGVYDKIYQKYIHNSPTLLPLKADKIFPPAIQ